MPEAGAADGADVLRQLPLFPLGTALFPGGYLPLRIFEVRYLDMVRKAHREGAPFGVVTLTQGSEVQRPAEPGGGAQGAYAPEAFLPVGTLAAIADLQAPQPGLLMIRCTGTRRLRVQRSEKLRHGLWVADVQLLPEEPAVPVPADLQPVADALRTVVERMRAQPGVAPHELPVQPPLRLDDCGWVANRWCELLPLAPDARQRMLALDNPLLRLELVGDLLGRREATAPPRAPG